MSFSPKATLAACSCEVHVCVQAPSSNVPPTGGHRHTLSHPQPPPYPGAPPPSDLTPEPSRASEGSLEGYATAQSTFSESLSHVQQHIRRLSAQSLSGFSDADTPRHAEAPTASQGADSLIQADPSHMGASQGGHMQPQHQQIDRNAVQQGGGHAWGAAQQQPCDRLINAVDWGRGPNPGAPSQQNSGIVEQHQLHLQPGGAAVLASGPLRRKHSASVRRLLCDLS